MAGGDVAGRYARLVRVRVCACTTPCSLYPIPLTARSSAKEDDNDDDDARERRHRRRRRTLLLSLLLIITIISVIAVAHARHDFARTGPECQSRLVRHTNFYLSRAIVMYDVFVVAIKPTAMSDPYSRVLVHCHTLPVTTAIADKGENVRSPSHVRMFSALSPNVLIKVGWDQPGPAAVAFTAAEGSDRFLMGKTGRNSRRTGRGVGHFSRSYADKKKKKNNKCGDL